MRVTTFAILGLRRVRAAYAERVTAWRQLSKSQREMDEETAASAAALLANAAAALPAAVAAVGADAAVNGAVREVEDSGAQGGGPAGGDAPISREVKLRQQLAVYCTAQYLRDRGRPRRLGSFVRRRAQRATLACTPAHSSDCETPKSTDSDGRR